ncbi:MAG: hypothetical protein M1816_001256 [Peltula sp. TS41687]|nr:MAG: hypothetical protein M1816_001256 [Peltula sp. TS41687]
MSSSTLMHHLQTWSNNLQTNVIASITQFSVYQFLRMVIIVGGYMLLRPYLLQLGGRFQAKDHERGIDQHDMKTSDAAVNPKSLRGHIVVPEDTDDEDGDEDGPAWGRAARRRQRRMVRTILENEDRLRAEEEEADSDKDIEEFLTDDKI